MCHILPELELTNVRGLIFTGDGCITCPLNSGVYEWYSMGRVGNVHVLCIDRVSGGIHI